MFKIKLFLSFMLFAVSTAFADGRHCNGAQGLQAELSNIKLGLNWLNLDHAVERSLLFLDVCPAGFFHVMRTDRALIDAWSRGLKSFASKLDERDRCQLVSSFSQSRDNRLPKDDESANAIRGAVLSAGQPVSRDCFSPQVRRSELYGRAINDTLADWHNADGEFVRWLSDDFLFLIALDPVRFASVVGNSPNVVESWLNRLRDLSFSGLAENKPRAEQYRAYLIAVLEQSQGNDLLRKVLDRLKQVEFRNVD